MRHRLKVLKISELRFSYPAADSSDGFRLHIPRLELATRDTLAITGPSGSGKTTLLNLIAGILQPASGTMELNGQNLAGLTDTQLRELRITWMGLVFQEFELLDYLNVRDNILLPYRISDALTLNADVHTRAEQLAEQVRIRDKLKRRPQNLSQGERQRVALCRALITQPKLILADEPTGNLDPANKGRAIDHLLHYVRDNDAALITVTHDHDLVDRFDRSLDFHRFLRDKAFA